MTAPRITICCTPCILSLTVGLVLACRPCAAADDDLRFQTVFKDEHGKKIEAATQVSPQEAHLTIRLHGFSVRTAAEKAATAHAAEQATRNLSRQLRDSRAYRGKTLKRIRHEDQSNGGIFQRRVLFRVAGTAGTEKQNRDEDSAGQTPARIRPVEIRSVRDTATHEIKQVEGWNVAVNKRLLPPVGDVGNPALQYLGEQLQRVKTVVPAKALKVLRQVPIWMESRPKKGSQFMVYHPSRQWLIQHNMNPRMARCIEISDPRKLMKNARADVQQLAVLHELAHAFHDRVLGLDNPRVEDTYRRAMATGKYNRVATYDILVDGSGRGTGRRKKMAKAYAASNAYEYFAECSEAYFGENDFYPITRTELEAFDPLGYRLMLFWEK